MLAFWHLQNRYQIFTTSSSLPTYSHRKNALKFFILLSITLQKKQSVTTNYQMSQAVAGLSSISVTDRYVSIINFLKMPNASLPLRLLLAYKPMRCSKTSSSPEEPHSAIFLYSQATCFLKSQVLKIPQTLYLLKQLICFQDERTNSSSSLCQESKPLISCLQKWNKCS